MTVLIVFLIGILISLPIAWLIAEFYGGRWLRISLGILAIGIVALGTWALNSVLTRFNYNAWYGGATGDLIRTSIKETENGNFDRVLKIWRGLEQQYRPTYENRAQYADLVREATSRMRGEVPIEAGSDWDAPAFNSDTWVGHWEEDYGYWIVINNLKRPFNIVRSGDAPTEMHSVTVSPDFTVLTFKEGDRWLHTLTLTNQYEARHEWFDLERKEVWKTRLIHKLIRASTEQKRMTQQKPVSINQPSQPLLTNAFSATIDPRR